MKDRYTLYRGYTRNSHFTISKENLNLLSNDPVVKKEVLGFICVIVLAEDSNGRGGSFGTAPEDKPARVESFRFQDLPK
jgi:hypothetical protein